MKPVIGITAGLSEGRLFLTEQYLSCVASAGGIPVVLPSYGPTVAADYLCFLDGIVFSGGGDLAPHFFARHSALAFGQGDEQRDEFELALARLAYEKRTPCLGICRGLQVMAVALGGSLYEDLSLKDGPVLPHRQTSPKWCASHQIALRGALRRLTGMSVAEVNSLHHQAVRELPAPLELWAATADGVIEAAGASDGRCYCGVQWHPEHLGRSSLGDGLIDWFVQENCRRKENN